MKTALELLESAKKVIEDPARWTQGAFARDEMGEESVPTAPNACQFCSIGALRKVYFTSDLTDPYARENWRIMLNAMHALNRVAGTRYCQEYEDTGSDIAHFNDDYTHAEVMEVWKEAIETEKQRTKEQETT